MATVTNYLALATGSWVWMNAGTVNLKPVGQPTIITYSFESEPSSDVRQLGGFTQAYWDSFQPLSAEQRVAAKAALDAWSAASGLIFIEAKPGMGDIRFGVYDFDKGGPYNSKQAAAFALFPSSGLGGDVFIGKTSYVSSHLFMHEIGHALGLKHPFDGDPTLPSELDNFSHTVMSYTSGGSPGGVLGSLDREAIAYLYGAPGTVLGGSWSWDAGSQILTQTNKAAGAFVRGVSSGNVITAGDGASVFAGSLNNTISAGDKAVVFWSWGQANGSAGGGIGSNLTLGSDAKVFTANYTGSLTITAAARADIDLPNFFDTSPSAAAIKVTMGAGGKITGNSFNGRVEVVAGDGATIYLPHLREAKPDAAIVSSISVGDSSTIYAGSYVHGLVVKAGAKANVSVGVGTSNVVVGENSTIYTVDVSSSIEQLNYFTLGSGGSFSGAASSLATNVVKSSGKTTIFGGSGKEVVFANGKNVYVDGRSGVDIVVIDESAPSSFNVSSDGKMYWVNNGAGADGVNQFWQFSNVEYAQFSGALYSFSQNKYLPDFPILKTAHASLLRSSQLDTSILAVADLADRVGSNKLSSAGAIDEIVKAAGATTSVATLAYQFFTGKIPSLNGIDYLVSPTGPNANNLNSAYYQTFNLENRYINFAVNLGKVGEGVAKFTAEYGSLSLFDATKKAYATIFGGTPTDTKVTALLSGGRDLYFEAYGKDGLSGVGTKAAMVGWLLAEAVKSDIGMMAKSNTAWLLDLSDGSAPFAISILDPGQGYFKPDFIFGGS